MKKIDKKIIQKISILRKEILDYNYKYYNLNFSEVPDFIFDKKLRELINLEKQYPELYDSNSPTIKIGTEVIENSKNYKYKMYSLKNAYSIDDLIDWNKKIKKSLKNFSFICELKYDGVSINLIYKKGILAYAVTRGNGETGENVTNNIRHIKSIPLKLKGEGEKITNYLEIRGEIFIPKKKFIDINKIRLKYGKKLYSNPRNTVSGLIKTKDINKIRKIKLSFVAFQIIGKNFITQYQALEEMKNFGFIIPNTARIFKRLEEVFFFVKKWEKYRYNLPYQIDGIVIKINECKKQLIAGYTNKYPKWAIAYKFKQTPLETKLLNIKYQVGRTGVITPVAQVNPVNISGTTIKKVNFYNNFFIQKKGICHGDIIFLEKGGDIIPIIKEINKSKRLNDTSPIKFLKKCPSCNSLLINKKKLFYCINNNCYSKIIMKFAHFVSVNGMNIKKIGINTIQKLYEKGFLKKIPDLFRLKKSDLTKIIGINEKLAFSIIDNIKKSKINPYHRVLYSLGIRNIGENFSKKLTEYFNDIDSLMNADYKNLISISGIGEKIAKNIILYFSILENRKIIKELMQHGLNFSKQSKKINHYSFLMGKSIVFTGKLPYMTRRRAKNIVESLGGKVYNNLNKDIDFLIVGKNFGSKLKKSFEKIQIQRLTEKEFKKILKKEGSI
ncbi:NAD-dependent DNA ligase LigA [Blattabacterium cuenoti]|uniref:NAD-dependent DNA ligase LigA n=1 Tax=Blattabacterium cuenoti TaxID=1653831 RepID=UPI00163D03AE|nr:NAD-dependent DNA ligase LigA [Blattabacterium cuenoti]